MIHPQKIRLAEIIPQNVLEAWRNNIKKICVDKCPTEVVQFIEALAAKLADFIQIREENFSTSGDDLLLGGMKEIGGVPINRRQNYVTTLPYMVATDHRAAMYRIFHRRGKQGLLDFCRTKVKGKELELTLRILNVVVFKEDRDEFKKVMSEIEASKKIEN